MKPLYEPPDYDCPNEFLPYKKLCLLPVRQVASYDDAEVRNESTYPKKYQQIDT